MAKASDIALRRGLAKANDDPEYRARRAELIAAAARVFQRKGLRAAKLDDIAKELGKDRASLYYYTSGKDELFQDVVVEAVRENVEAVERLRDDEGPADRKLAMLIESLMGSYEQHFPFLYVYIQEPMTQLDEDVAWQRQMMGLQRQFDDSVRAIVQQGLDEKTLSSPVTDARLIANGIIGMCNWSHRWFQPKAGVTKDIVKAFSAMVLQGLTPRD